MVACREDRKSWLTQAKAASPSSWRPRQNAVYYKLGEVQVPEALTLQEAKRGGQQVEPILGILVT